MTSFYGEYRQKDIISDEEGNRVSRANVDKWIFRLLLLLIGLMPIIVLGHVEEVVSPLISDVSVLTSGNKGDLFTHYKSIMIITITIIVGLLFLAKIFFMNGTIRKTKVNYILGVFVVAIVVSTMFSPNITIALDGQYNRSDGAIMWLCYIALMVIAMNINYPKQVVSYVMYALNPFVFINLYIITMNFTGQDLMQKQWVQSIVSVFLPEGVSMTEGSQIVGTLNQWNYMSGMFAIMTVMYLAWMIFDSSLINKIFGFVAAAASISVMFMSISTSGFITTLLIFVLFIGIIFRAENKYKNLVIFIIFLCLSAGILNILAKENPKVWSESVGFFIDNNPYVQEENIVSKEYFNDDNNVLIEETNLNVNLSNKVYATDSSFKLPTLPDRSLAPGSGRIYIWEKTMGLVKERMIIGYGLDSLMYNFPHYNIDARSGMLNENDIVDKPHNTYLGILYGTGIVGFLLYFIILIYLAVHIFIYTFIKFESQIAVLGIAILAYLLQSMFNDSIPGVSAIAWVFMGVFFALIITRKNEEELNNCGRDN